MGLVERLPSNGVKVDLVKDAENNLRKLLANRIDAFPMNEVVGQSIIDANLSEAEKNALAIYQEKALAEELMHAVFSPNARGRELAEAFEKGLAILKENGRFDELMTP